MLTDVPAPMSGGSRDLQTPEWPPAAAVHHALSRLLAERVSPLLTRLVGSTNLPFFLWERIRPLVPLPLARPVHTGSRW